MSEHIFEGKYKQFNWLVKLSLWHKCPVDGATTHAITCHRACARQRCAFWLQVSEDAARGRDPFRERRCCRDAVTCRDVFLRHRRWLMASLQRSEDRKIRRSPRVESGARWCICSSFFCHLLDNFSPSCSSFPDRTRLDGVWQKKKNKEKKLLKKKH